MPTDFSLVSALTLLVATTGSLFSIVNPINATPVFISLTESDSDAQRLSSARRACIFMFFILISFFIGGAYIMNFFGLSIPGIRIAGGLMLASSAFNMLNPEHKGRKLTREEVDESQDKLDISFTPLAMPLLSGPGSIATVITIAAETKEYWQDIVIILSVLILATITFLILRVAPWAVRVMGKTGLSVLTKIMGFIVLSVAVQFIINGIVPILHG